jgi:hypothetical protein
MPAAGWLSAIMALIVSAAGGSILLDPTTGRDADAYRLAAFHGIDGSVCDQNPQCDRTTGCIAPVRPEGAATDVLPDDEVHSQHVRELADFQLCRRLAQVANDAQGGGWRQVNLGASRLEDFAFADLVQRWNGAYLWAPASASTETITRFGDEVRAVLGPIPEGSCADGGNTKTLSLQIDGNIVDLKPNLNKPGHPLEFEHRDVAGNLVKWTSSIFQCDKPSLTGSNLYCGLNSRLSRVQRGNVDWLFFCRKSSPSGEVTPTPYWQRSNPKFALLGVIGFNRRTGETAFFDGRKDRDEFDWSQTFAPPGGMSYSDRKGRERAERLYDRTFSIECSACHDNKSAYVITPSVLQARVGFGTNQDRVAAGLSLGNFLPVLPRHRSTPYRIIGSAYTAAHRASLERAKTVRDPSGKCTECHTLTNQVTGQRFAADAVAQAPTIEQPRRSQFLRLKAEQRKLEEIAANRTHWATRDGRGKIHPWMVPIEGNNPTAQAPGLSATDWSVLSNCLWGAGGAECDYRPLYTACPAPGVAEQGDASEPRDFSAKVLPILSADLHSDRLLRLNWRYLNNYGNVPERDDVRFNIAITSTDIPVSRAAPAAESYPAIEDAEDKSFMAIVNDVGASSGRMLIRNLSYLGHAKFTEPTSSSALRSYHLDLPARCNRRYLIRLLPKRFCFDQNLLAYGKKDYLHYVDVMCH